MLKLAPTLRPLPRLVKEANGTAAFFTSVPTTFAPFGFDAAWDAFEAFSPVKDIAATEPFARASRRTFASFNAATINASISARSKSAAAFNTT